MRVPQVSERIKEAPAQALRGVFAGIGQLLLITDKLRNKAPADEDVPRARAPETAETVTDTTVTSPAGQREETAAAPAEAVATEPVATGPVATGPVATGPVATGPVATGPEAGEPDAAAPAAAEPTAAEAAVAKAAVAEPAPAAKPAAAKRATARTAPAKPVTAKPATKPGTKPTAARRPAAKPATTDPAATADPAAELAPKPPKPQGARDFDKTGNVRVLGDEAEGSAPAAEPVNAAAPASAEAPESGPAESAPPLPNYDELSVASLRARLRNLDVAQVRQLADYERGHAARADVLAMFERRVAKLEAEG